MIEFIWFHCNALFNRFVFYLLEMTPGTIGSQYTLIILNWSLQCKDNLVKLKLLIINNKPKESLTISFDCGFSTFTKSDIIELLRHKYKIRYRNVKNFDKLEQGINQNAEETVQGNVIFFWQCMIIPGILYPYIASAL